MRKFLQVLVLVCVTLCGLVCPAPVFPEKNTVVHVGFFELGDYMYRNRNGEHHGLIFEFLQEISRISGLHFEVVDCGGWTRALEMFEAGNIDVLPAVHHTPERAQKMLFPSLPLASSFMTLNVRKDDNRYIYDDHPSFQGMRVGVIAGSSNKPFLQDFCRDHNITINIVEFQDVPSMQRALRNGELDGIAAYLGKNNPFRVVAQFAPKPFYLAVHKQRPHLLASINDALNKIFLRNPQYGLDLYGKYLSGNSPHLQPVFSRDEEALLLDGRPVTVAYDPTWPPLAFSDPKTGEFSGVVADVFKFLAESSGLQFHFIPMPQRQCLEQIIAGTVDAVAMVTGDFVWDKRMRMRTTRPFLRTATALVRLRSGQQDIQRIALQRGYILSAQVAEDNPGKELLYFDDVRGCFDALIDGRADAAYTNVHVGSYLRAEARYSSLEITPLNTYGNDLRIGLSHSADPRLSFILDKSIQFLPIEQIDSLVLKHSITGRVTSLGEFINQHPTSVVGGVVILFGVIVILLACGLAIKSSSNRRIQALLYLDTLTGLPNLEKFRIDSMARLANTSQDHVLLCCDINQFKTVNDQFGFSMGDHLLRAYADILQHNTGSEEYCARVSADMFVLLLQYEDWEHLSMRVRQIERELDQWRCDQDMPYKIGTAYGAYLCNREGNRDAQIMLDLANYARREAKRSTSALVLYDEHMREEALLHQELNGRLEVALVQGELETWYQAKVDMRTGTIVGSEALARWNHHTRGLLMPGSFIPLFERNGSIATIDFYMFEQCCKALHYWHTQGLPTRTVSCNFSSMHFERPEFPQQLAQIAERYNVPHSLLEVEITESTIMQNPEAAWMQLIQIKQHGFKTAIDDFGSGYSSLGLLQMLHADVVKIDRSFVQRDLPSERAQTVLGNIIRLAMDLEMAVICEGVETAEQAAIIMRLGCYRAQGFYYARPEPRHVFEARLMKERPSEV